MHWHCCDCHTRCDFLVQINFMLEYKHSYTVFFNSMRHLCPRDVTKHRTVRTGAKYRSWVLVKCVWCCAYYWFRLRKGTFLHLRMHFWLACCYSCCLFSVRYRCIWGRCGRCGVSWHPCPRPHNIWPRPHSSLASLTSVCFANVFLQSETYVNETKHYLALRLSTNKEYT